MEEFILKIKELFQRVFHIHKWKIIKEQEISVWGNSGEKYPIQRYMNYILQCEECGKLLHKKYKL